MKGRAKKCIVFHPPFSHTHQSIKGKKQQQHNTHSELFPEVTPKSLPTKAINAMTMLSLLIWEQGEL